MLPFFLAPSIHRFQHYTPDNIVSIAKKYEKLGESFGKADCVRSRNRMIMLNELGLMPQEYRSYPIKGKAVNDLSIVESNGQWFTIYRNEEKTCENPLSIPLRPIDRY